MILLHVGGRRRRGACSVLYPETFQDSRPIFQPFSSAVAFAPRASGVRLEPLSNSQNAVLVSWDGPADRAYSVFVDGLLVDRIRGNSTIVPFPSNSEDHIVEVLLDEELPTSWEVPPSRARLVWVRPEANVREYRVYWDAGSGSIDYDSPLDVVLTGNGNGIGNADNGDWSFAWVTPRLSDNVTYLFSVRAVDSAGNESSTVLELPITLRTLPEPVRNLDASYDFATKKITITGE